MTRRIKVDDRVIENVETGEIRSAREWGAWLAEHGAYAVRHRTHAADVGVNIIRGVRRKRIATVLGHRWCLRRAHKPGKLDKMTFMFWLSKQLDRNDAIGDLARDADGDEGFPRSARLTDYETHLRDNEACDAAIKTLVRAWAEYEKWQRKRN